MLLDNGTVYVDNSTLVTVARCDTEAALRSVLGLTLQEDKWAADLGTAVHDVLAEYMRGKSPEFCKLKFELLWRPVSEAAGLEKTTDDAPYSHLSYSNMSKILGNWLDINPLATQPFSVPPGLVEVGFELPLIDECVCGHVEADHPHGGCRYRGGCGCAEYRPAFVFWGRADALVLAQHDNALYVLDHKTRYRIDEKWINGFRLSSQLSGYAWAAGKTLGQPVAGVYINAIPTERPPSATNRRCPEHGTMYAECGVNHRKGRLLIFERTDAQIAQWHSDAVALARRYRALHAQVSSLSDLHTVPMTGTFHGACSACSFSKFCQGNRPIHHASSMLVHSPWRPY
jgi:hypothetical protein